MSTIAIVTPWKDGADTLLEDYARAIQDAHEVVTVDNGSAEATAQALQAAGGAYIRNDTNLGFAAANNQGYEKSTADIVVFLNSDVAGDARFVRAVAADVRDGALYGPSLGYQLVYGMHLPYLEGWCIAATRQTWDMLSGPWDALAYPGPYWEDNDLCLRAMQAGISLIQTAWGGCIAHKGGRTAGALIKHGETFERNRATFAQRARLVWEATQR